MNAKDLRIVFMGTPEFAVPSLRALADGGYNIVAVVTTPDKPAGRGRKLHESDVKIAARELGLPVYVWSVYDGERMLQYLEMGVSGIITDYPEEIRRVLDGYLASHPGQPYQWTGAGVPGKE